MIGGAADRDVGRGTHQRETMVTMTVERAFPVESNDVSAVGMVSESSAIERRDRSTGTTVEEAADCRSTITSTRSEAVTRIVAGVPSARRPADATSTLPGTRIENV